MTAHAVVAHRQGKSPKAVYVTTDKDEADRSVEEWNSGTGKTTTYYQVETYDPNVHTGQPKMTAEASAEVGFAAYSDGQAKRRADGYTDQDEAEGKAK